VGGARFVADEDVADAFIAEQRIIDRKHGAAGIAEHIFDALGDQAFDQDFSAAALAFHDLVSLLSGGPQERPYFTKTADRLLRPEPSKTVAGYRVSVPAQTLKNCGPATGYLCRAVSPYSGT
jgi:hypothetical protein